MFTWICPQCGREVPPSYSECPDCAERAAAAAKVAANPQPPAPPPPAAPPMPAAPPTTTAPPSAAAPEVGQPQVQYVYVDRPRQPGWLIALLVAIALVGIGGAAYYYLLPSVRASREGAGSSPKVSLETPKEGASTEVSAAARMRKYLEITGLRIIEQKQRPQLKYVIVNHSSAELAGIKGSLVLRASNAAPDAPPVAVVPIEIPSLDAYGVQEVTTTLKTNLRAYEMPDWQFLKAELQLN